MPYTVYTFGCELTLRARFTAEDRALDPDQVSLHLKRPRRHDWQILTFGQDPEIERVEAGTYELSLGQAEIGTWRFYWQADDLAEPPSVFMVREGEPLL